MPLILTEPSKKDKLKGWMVSHGLTYAKLGAGLDMAQSAVFALLHSDTARPERVEQLKALGVPAEFLPEPKYTPPGPKPRRAAANRSGDDSIVGL